MYCQSVRQSPSKLSMVRMGSGPILTHVKLTLTVLLIVGFMVRVNRTFVACLHVMLNSSPCLFYVPLKLHCVNGDGHFDRWNGFWTCSVRQSPITITKDVMSKQKPWAEYYHGNL